MEELYPLLSEVVKSGGEFRLFPRGVSMLPLLCEGKDSVALVSVTEPKKGKIYLYRRPDGQFVLHRCMGVEGDTLTFCGDNQRILERGVRRDALIAEVAAVYKGEKRIGRTAARAKLYRLVYATRLGFCGKCFLRRAIRKILCK